MNRINKAIIILVFGTIYGLSWGSIYLFFSAAHGMIKMFNTEFLFVVATIFKIEILTKSTGFIFTFIDGFLIGILIGLFLLKITRFNSPNKIIHKIQNQ